MKRNSLLLAKLAILLSLTIGTTSAFYANQSKATVSQARSSIAKLDRDIRDLSKSRDAVRAVLTHQAPAPVLEMSLSTLMVTVMSERLTNRITVASVLPAKNVSGADATPFDRLSDTVEGTSLKSARINIRGTYKSYEGFLAYVAKLREQPVAVVALKVDGNSFELGLRAYGT